MRLASSALLAVCTILPALIPTAAHAVNPRPGASFSHKNWQLECDNTRTCRAAGYSEDADEMPVSILLTRKAGPNQEVTAEVMLGNYDNEDVFKKLPQVFKLSMRVNGKDAGTLELAQAKMSADLSTQQLNTLLAALAHDSKIEFSIKNLHWQVSDQGATATLLKMDEFQGRLGTKGALIKKGTAGEEKVLPAVPAPIIIAAPVSKNQADDVARIKKLSSALRSELLKSVKGDDECINMQESGKAETSFEVNRLSGSKLLVSTVCWTAAYNAGSGFWVINDKAPFQPVLVTTSGSEYDAGRISSAQKGRGMGDCWGSEAWTWDGKQFVYSESSSTGLCKMIAPGGAWHLPAYVTEVRPAKP